MKQRNDTNQCIPSQSATKTQDETHFNRSRSQLYSTKLVLTRRLQSIIVITVTLTQQCYFQIHNAHYIKAKTAENSDKAKKVLKIFI